MAGAQGTEARRQAVVAGFVVAGFAAAGAGEAAAAGEVEDEPSFLAGAASEEVDVDPDSDPEEFDPLDASEVPEDFSAESDDRESVR